MSRACQCCRTCLENSLGCRCCEASCCGKSKKKKGAVKEADWFLDLFSWTRAVGGDNAKSFQRQLFLLCWKRVTENQRNTLSTSLYFGLPTGTLIVLKIMYGAFTGFDTFRSSGSLETFAAPLMFIIAVQMTSVSLVMEKSTRLLESCRMMGMKELPYWLSFAIVDAGLQGFLLSFLMSSLGGIMGLFWTVGQGRHGHGDGASSF